jgi:long-chain acyl-CoA synthetase
MNFLQQFQSFFKIFPNSFLQNGKNNVSYKSLHQSAEDLQKAFFANGIEFQDKIVIISQPCIEWVLCDLASVKSGIITIPLFHNSSNETLSFQIQDSNPHTLIIEDETILETILQATNFQFKNIFLINESKKFPSIKTIWQIINENKNSNMEAKIINSTTNANEDSIATIIYTSGTSGLPKGVILTYKNLFFQLSDIHNAFNNVKECHNAISILPLAHIYQRTIIFFFLSKGVNIFFINDIPNILKHIKTIQPHLITIVPRILEKIYSRIQNQIETKPKIIRKILLSLFKYSSTHQIHNIFFKKILNIIFFKKVKEIFGKNIFCIVSGGAKLNLHDEIFFHNAKLPIFQGYGMTECSPVIASNCQNIKKIFTVGKPFHNIEVKISEIGEICVRGLSVFNGYLNQNKRNENEFFHTGDLGTLDSHGFLTVTGRIKEQCKNSNGKFINLIKIESMLNEISGIENSCVIAEGKPYTTAILFTQNNNFDYQTAINEINTHLEHWEQVQYFYITNEKPTVENNIITPTLKIRRNIIMEKYSNEIENLYKK